jgi:hypothetical protein
MADSTNALSQTVLDAADGVQAQSRSMRQHVETFLGAANAASRERRLHTRVPGNGRIVLLRRADTPEATLASVVLADISCGGAALLSSMMLPRGTEILLEFPDAPGKLRGSITNCTGVQIGLAFAQDAQTKQAAAAIVHNLDPDLVEAA